jgi:hypothetical protein
MTVNWPLSAFLALSGPGSHSQSDSSPANHPDVHCSSSVHPQDKLTWPSSSSFILLPLLQTHSPFPELETTVRPFSTISLEDMVW